MDGTLAWYMARAGGLLAWVLLSASVLWGLFLSTKALGKNPRPAWLLDLHRFLGAAAVVFTGVHIATLLADSYTDLSWLQVLVPFTSSWRPVAVAWGVVAMDLLLAVELTSLLRKHLSRTWWRRIHLSSFALFVVASVHAVTAGTDRIAVLAIAAVTVAGVAVLTGLRVAGTPDRTPVATPTTRSRISTQSAHRPAPRTSTRTSTTGALR